jgi:hypothetical protein
MAADPMSRHYEALQPHERFVLLVEAMARREGREADRLEDTCPRLTYRMEDAGFRDRVRRAHATTMTVCLNIREGLAHVRIARALRELSGQFATPVLRLAEVALLCGRAYGHWEAGAVEKVGVPDPQARRRWRRTRRRASGRRGRGDAEGDGRVAVRRGQGTRGGPAGCGGKASAGSAGPWRSSSSSPPR